MASARVHSLILRLLFLVAPMLGAESASAASGNDFVDTFGKACLPERLSFAKSVTRAPETGWKKVAETADPELANIMALGRKAVKDPEYPEWKHQFETFTKTIDDGPVYLIMTRIVAPELATMFGCYLYDFAATAPAKPEAVSKLLNHTIAYSTLDKSGDAYADPTNIISHVWGPPPSLPRQFDTYLTFIPENSPLVKQTGFSGLVLKSSASEPKP